MRAVVQRVSRASVSVDGEKIAEIGKGLLILAAVGIGDGECDIDYIIDKVTNMRVFPQDGKFDLSVLDVGGEVLAVSNFTLYGDVRKGRRPSFSSALPPQEAEAAYERFVSRLSEKAPVKSGKFRAMMEVELVNDGPVTILLDSKKGF